MHSGSFEINKASGRARRIRIASPSKRSFRRRAKLFDAPLISSAVFNAPDKRFVRDGGERDGEGREGGGGAKGAEEIARGRDRF